jgi:hypothetical protein
MHKNPYLPETVLILAGLALRLVFAALPHNAFLMLFEDDAWMVTNIARHWAMGHGTTADGVHPTNGFHPLYPMTLGALPYLVFPDNLHLGFRLNVLICAVLNGLALIPFYGLARLVARRPVALAGLAIMALNPFLLRVSVNGMETSLALLLLLSAWWYGLRHQLERVREGVLMGILAGLAVLARLDAILAMGIFGLVALWHEMYEQRVPPFSLSYGITTFLVLLPYVLRNVLFFSDLTPSSGRAISYMHSFRESFALSSGLQAIAYQTAFDFTWAAGWLLLLIAVLLGAMVWRVPEEKRQLLIPLILYALLLTFYYAYIQQQGRPRYYVGVGVVVLLIVCAWVDELWQTVKRPDFRISSQEEQPLTWSSFVGYPLALAGAAILLNTTLFVSHVVELRRAPYLAQPSMYHAARWIAENLPPDATLAAQNSGVFQYYSERVVLNFDGKLNDEIIPVLEQRQLDVYLRSEGVDYIVDLEGVADYVEFYSSNLSEAPPHHELSAFDKLTIYTQLVAAKVGLAPPVELDEREPTRIIRPFHEVTTVVRRFPLPNDPTRAVTIYRLKADFGGGP